MPFARGVFRIERSGPGNFPGGEGLRAEQRVAFPGEARSVDHKAALANRLQGADEQGLGGKRLAQTSGGSHYDKRLATARQCDVQEARKVRVAVLVEKPTAPGGSIHGIQYDRSLFSALEAVNRSDFQPGWGRPTQSCPHLAEDPAEETDLAESEEPRARNMRAALDAWLESVVRSLNGEDYVGG